MIRICFATERYSPYRHTIAIATSINWAQIIPASYERDCWAIELNNAAFEAGFEFKFIVNGDWQAGPNLTISAGDAGKQRTYRDEDVPLERPEPRGPLPERGRVQRRYFPSGAPAWQPDVIVIGSGMGGGTVAERLSDLGLKVLVLEAGGLVFPTHIANLPRRQRIGEFDKHLWQLWPDFRALPFRAGAFDGGQGFNLGGRSVFWGGFIPRMTSWELDYWPRQVKWDLEDTYYDKAEALMGKSTAPATLYGQYVHTMLTEQLPEYAHKDAPMAVRVRYEGSNWIAGGLFSTADLLMESILTPGPFGKDNLRVLLNHDVIAIEPEAGFITVRAHDMLRCDKVSYKAPRVVLAAGTIESAKIAHRSRLTAPPNLIGRGITDHPVYFTHFRIKSGSEYYDPFGNVKTLSQPKEGLDHRRDPFNVLMELGADFNHGRYLDETILQEHIRRRDFSMLCEIVFLCNQELDDSNTIEFSDGPGPEDIKMAEPSVPEPVMKRILSVRDKIIRELGGEILRNAEGHNSEGFGGIGGVAHEVGTLRMRVQDGTRVEDGLKKPSEGIVDECGKWIGYDGLYVCDLSFFPTSPAANPSLTLVALALRLADHLKGI